MENTSINIIQLQILKFWQSFIIFGVGAHISRTQDSPHILFAISYYSTQKCHTLHYSEAKFATKFDGEYDEDTSMIELITIAMMMMLMLIE